MRTYIDPTVSDKESNNMRPTDSRISFCLPTLSTYTRIGNHQKQSGGGKSIFYRGKSEKTKVFVRRESERRNILLEERVK